MNLPKHPDTIYRGERIEGPKGEYRGVRVTVDGKPLQYPPTIPQIATGPEWGYRGAGCALLALAIIFDVTGDWMLARRAYKWFAWGRVSSWGSSWSITAERVEEWLAQWRRESAEEPIEFPNPDDEDADAVGLGDTARVVGPLKLAVDRPQASPAAKGGVS